MDNIATSILNILLNIVTRFHVMRVLFVTHRFRQRRLLQQIFNSTDVNADIRSRVALMVNRRPRNQRRFWIRPGRTSAWWQNFIDDIVVPEEWRENFRMSKENFFKLCDEIRPYLIKQRTAMREPLSVEKQVAVTLYYLADEGRYRKVGNAFGISRSTVSVVLQKVCNVITRSLGPKYIKLPTTKRLNF